MENFNFYSPTEFVFGKDRESEVGSYVKKYGGTKVLIHYGGGSAVKSGLIDKVKKSLDDVGIEYCELGAKEEDIPLLVEKTGIGDGKFGGFMELDRNDVTEIYRIAVHASL